MTRLSNRCYLGGIMMGLGFGWMLASVLQRMFVMVEQDVTAVEWANLSILVCVVLSFTGISIVCRARRAEQQRSA